MTDTLESIISGSSLIRERWLPPEMAVREVVNFERRFGPKHLWLACHAAMPLIITPELVNLIQLNFLDKEKVPWLAQTDFLLSPLCRPIDEGLYEVEPGVREVLLVELENIFGWHRPLALAHFLQIYLREKPDRHQRPDISRTHHWLALAYIDPDRVIEEMNEFLEKSLVSEDIAKYNLLGHVQLATMLEVAAEPLERANLQTEYQYLLNNSRVLAEKLYGDEQKSRHNVRLEKLSSETAETESILVSPLLLKQLEELDQHSTKLSELPKSDVDSVIEFDTLKSSKEDNRILEEQNQVQTELAFDPHFIENLRYPVGAVRPSDPFYIERDVDVVLKEEMTKQHGTTTIIRGSRQIGKTSLLIRGILHARSQGKKDCLIDLQMLDSNHLASFDSFLQYLAFLICNKLGLDEEIVKQVWRGRTNPSEKLTRLMEMNVLLAADESIVLAIDEADRLLSVSFHDDFFGLLRTWHDRRAFSEIWEKLSIVLIMSTEPFLLISDVAQSPFNVGLHIRLGDFDETQVRDLNQRYGSPLSEAEIPAFMELLGGHPYLTQSAFYTLVTEQLTWTDLTRVVLQNNSPFSDHLRRYNWLLRYKPRLQAALWQIITDNRCSDEKAIFRLLSAGLVKGQDDIYTCRCELYRMYFEDKFGSNLAQNPLNIQGFEDLDLQASIVLITSNDPKIDNFGTGFIIHQDEQNTYVLTCTHIVEAMGGSNHIVVDGIISSVSSLSMVNELDLAVLKVEGLKDKSTLYLGISDEESGVFITTGFQRFNQRFMIKTFQGKLEKPVNLTARGESDYIKAWGLKMDGGDLLPQGYSGAPVVDQASGKVVGVISHRQDQGERGLAISIETLPRVWSDMPHNLLEGKDSDDFSITTISQHLAFLQEALEHHSLALFIGGNLPPEITGLPSRRDLARDLARRKGLDQSLSLAEVAQRVSQAGHRWEFTNFLRTALDTTGKAPQPFHQRLAALVKAHQIETIITTAYDNLLELAFQKAGLGFTRVVRGSDVNFIDPGRPTLIKLYGDLQQPDTLVVTDQDHSALLRDREREAIIDELRGCFRRTTLLFLGYDLTDPDFRFLFDQIAESRFARQAYAVWPGLPETEVRMWRDRGVVILESLPIGRIDDFSPDPDVPNLLYFYTFSSPPLNPPEQAFFWHSYFDRSQNLKKITPNAQIWENELLPELYKRREEIGGWGTIHCATPVPLSVGLAIGHIFPRVGRYRIGISQQGSSDYWYSDAEPPDGVAFQPNWHEKIVFGHDTSEEAALVIYAVKGRDQAELLAQIGDYWQELQVFDQLATDSTNEPTIFSKRFKQIMLLQAEPATTESRFLAEWETAALAIESCSHLARLARDAKTVHLFLITSSAMATFLGHQWNAYNITLQFHEWIGGSQKYLPSVRLQLA